MLCDFFPKFYINVICFVFRGGFLSTRFSFECSLPAPSSGTELWWPHTVLSGGCWEDRTGLSFLSLFFISQISHLKLTHLCVCRYALRRTTPSFPTLLMSWLCIKPTPTHETASLGSMWCVDIFTKLSRISPWVWSLIWQRCVQLKGAKSQLQCVKSTM